MSRASALVLAGALILGAWRPGSGACTAPVDFGQLSANCGSGYCYVRTPGTATSATLLGSFWTFEAGDPAVGEGNDNGGLETAAWLSPFGAGFYLAGTWSESPQIDGCIVGHVAPGKPAEVMLAAFGDDGGTTSYFAVASARHAAGSFPEYDFTFVEGGGTAEDIVLVETPRIGSITSPLRDRDTITGATLTQLAPGIYGDGTLADGEAVIGYRVYTGPTAWTSLRRNSPWTAASAIVPPGSSVTLDIPCPADTGELQLTQSIVFESGFESAYLARPSKVICNRCPPGRIDPDGDGFPSFSDPECCPMDEVCDCDDGNDAVFPGAVEVCNGVDDDCDAAVDDLAGLRLAKGPAGTSLDWEGIAGTPLHDVVRGDLATLAATSGDFARATDTCLAASLAATHAEDATVPPPGAGAWYLVRVRGCGVEGSYDDTFWGRRVAARDPGIVASGVACP